MRADGVAIIGPGAIGSTVAAVLHEAGRTPGLYGRTARDGLDVLVGDDAIRVPGPVRTDPERVGGAAAMVFLAVKATQIEGAAPWLAKLCGPDTVLCVLQNGVEQRAMVSPLVPEGTVVVPAVVWFPAQAQGDGSVRLRGAARLTLPEVAGTERVVETLRGTRCTVEVASDFSSVAWRKLLQNAAAGLMALTGRRAGMFAREDVAELALRYLRECLRVARAEGARLDDGVPEQILAGFRSSPADLSTSILTDREAGRALEWDIRNGVIARLGATHGIPTPISDVLTPLLAATSDGPG
ncbi:oxidoreductase [Microbacterium saperdae]|uniref:2-dehydropantoate 2-reductase n=1 Tax=Microbacterium saperdae TaxID=69368 RepID=A0A543BIK6_9MICO|nr:oxidoreductase [Microbacterium saperdae]TQL84675.1 ketopantoate reductase [Microbacterium saperdae]GGM65087.1 2-dehydropantoate 2-reductase [Microbacterium saperdae]